MQTIDRDNIEISTRHETATYISHETMKTDLSNITRWMKYNQTSLMTLPVPTDLDNDAELHLPWRFMRNIIFPRYAKLLPPNETILHAVSYKRLQTF